MASDSGLVNPLFHPFIFLYQILQWLTDKLLSPKPPGQNARQGRPKIAVIGAGITGVTAAAHCIGHGFEVVIFEAGSKDHVGGIWSVSHSFDKAPTPANDLYRESMRLPACKSIR